ncbi:MAG: hypothetical protein MJZ26_03690 [Fibrobacter sp.]|nr:hypothetical protein [Fibrobacter sp.]
MIKKEYKAPKMNILDMKSQMSLLSCSGFSDCPDATEYDDEFGFFNRQDKNRQA